MWWVKASLAVVGFVVLGVVFLFFIYPNRPAATPPIVATLQLRVPRSAEASPRSSLAAYQLRIAALNTSPPVPGPEPAGRGLVLKSLSSFPQPSCAG